MVLIMSMEGFTMLKSEMREDSMGLAAADAAAGSAGS